MDVSKLEPAERNFKRELTTLILILVIAFAAGGLILFNYIKMRQAQDEDVRQGRAPEMAELVKNYSFKNKKNEDASFFDYTGKVTFIACFSADQLEDNTLVLEALKRYAEIYKDDDRVKILLVSLDDVGEKPVSEIMPKLESAGMLGDKWDIAASNGELFLAYVKKQLKFIHLSANKYDGKWKVPQRIRLLAPDLKLKGREAEYDFEKAHSDTLEAREELKDNVKFAQDPDYKGDVTKIDLVLHTEKTIQKAVDYILANENFDKIEINEEKKKNIYFFPLIFFGVFILFVVLMGLKVKRKQAEGGV